MIDVVARTVRAHRTELGWSLDQLATRAGVSKGSVVAVENGAGNPNLATLVHLADALGVSVSTLLEDEERRSVRMVHVGDVEPLWRGPKGGASTLVLTTAGPSPVELWQWTLPEGERYDSHPHPAGIIQTVTVVAGAAVVSVAGTDYRLAQGDVVTFAADVEHSYEGADSGGARLAMTVHLLPTSTGRARP